MNPFYASLPLVHADGGVWSTAKESRITKRNNFCRTQSETGVASYLIPQLNPVQELYASNMIMRPERETVEHRNPCPGGAKGLPI
jgi:hypothetical protein